MESPLSAIPITGQIIVASQKHIRIKSMSDRGKTQKETKERKKDRGRDLERIKLGKEREREGERERERERESKEWRNRKDRLKEITGKVSSTKKAKNQRVQTGVTIKLHQKSHMHLEKIIQ